MTAIAWATFGLILTTVGILAGALFAAIARTDALGARMDVQGSDLGSRIERQGAELGARIDAQGAELGARIDAQGAELRDEIRSLRVETNSRFDALHEDIRELRAAVASR